MEASLLRPHAVAAGFVPSGKASAFARTSSFRNASFLFRQSREKVLTRVRGRAVVTCASDRGVGDTRKRDVNVSTVPSRIAAGLTTAAATLLVRRIPI